MKLHLLTPPNRLSQTKCAAGGRIKGRLGTFPGFDPWSPITKTQPCEAFSLRGLLDHQPQPEWQSHSIFLQAQSFLQQILRSLLISKVIWHWTERFSHVLNTAPILKGKEIMVTSCAWGPESRSCIPRRGAHFTGRQIGAEISGSPPSRSSDSGGEMAPWGRRALDVGSSAWKLPAWCSSKQVGLRVWVVFTTVPRLILDGLYAFWPLFAFYTRLFLSQMFFMFLGELRELLLLTLIGILCAYALVIFSFRNLAFLPQFFLLSWN